MRIFTISFLFVLLLFPFAIIQARIIHVPADSSTIQAGINGASDGDTVLVARGHYYERINFLGKAILVASNFIFDHDTTTIDSTIIDGNSLVGDTCSVVVFVSGEDSNSIINGFTIQNGIGTTNPWGYRLGAGVYCYHSSPAIIDNTIIGNSSTFGGGILCDYSSPIIISNTITDNSASEAGAGIYYEYSSPTINYNTIGGNSSGEGGGIACWGSSGSIRNNTITGNFTSYLGGAGIRCFKSSPAIINNTITGNSSHDEGGGIYCDQSSPKITNNTVADNSAAAAGGIFCGFDSSPTISNNNISNNSGKWGGGGIYCYDGSSPIISNNTITGNSTSWWGGGILCYWNSLPAITNNIISNSLDGEGIACIDQSYPAIQYNNVWNNVDGNFYNCPAGIGDTTWGANFNGIPCDSFYNIIRDPLFADTINFELLCNSPCIDAGDPNISVPIDSGGCRIDMGAHEYLYILGDANSDGIITPKGSKIGAVNISDIVYLINFLFVNGSPSCPYHATDTNCDGLVNIVDVVCLINYLFIEGPLPCGF